MKTLKNFLAMAAILFFASCTKDTGKAQVSAIPQAVKENFKADHPNTKNAKWEKEGEYFEAEFKENGKEKSVVYDANGKLISTETEIDLADLPAAITEYVSTNYNGYTIEEAEKEENNEGIYFEVELENGNQETELVFDSQGNFVKHETEGENEEADEEGEDDENESKISTSELPQAIKAAINEQYPGAEVLEANEVTQLDGGFTYDVEIKENGNITELMYDAQGNFLGVEADDDDNGENDD